MQPTFFSALTGNVLLDADLPSHALLVAFSRPLGAISLDFALDTQFSGTLSLVAYLGAVPVGSSSTETGIIPPGGTFRYPEGSVAFAGAVFDNVVITSTEMDYAVDNVRVVPAVSTIPEPTAPTLLASGLALLGAVVVRGRPRARRRGAT